MRKRSHLSHYLDLVIIIRPLRLRLRVRQGLRQFLWPVRFHEGIGSVVLDPHPNRPACGRRKDLSELHAAHVARDLDVDLVFRETKFEEGLETKV